MDEQPRSTVRTINAGKARVNLGEMLDEVYYKGEQFIIERAGKPRAAVVPVWQLEEFQKLHGRPKKSVDAPTESKRRTNKRRA
jgi:prevent-host-death family protein